MGMPQEKNQATRHPSRAGSEGGRNQIPNKISVPGLKTQYFFNFSCLFISLINALIQRPIVHSPFIPSGAFLEPVIHPSLFQPPPVRPQTECCLLDCSLLRLSSPVLDALCLRTCWYFTV